MIKNRYFKSLLGVFAQVLVGKNVAYTSQTTYGAFVTSGTIGSIGIFNAQTGALLTAAAAAGTEVFIALKRKNSVKKTTPFKVGELKASKAPYVAAVAQVSTVATAAGATVAAGDVLELLVVETTPGDLRYESRIQYSHIVTAGQTLVQAVTSLVNRINADNTTIQKDNDPCVTAAITNTDDISLTAKGTGRHFTVALRGKLAEIASVSVTTAYNTGSGTSEMVAELEEIGHVSDGVTTNYPVSFANPSDFGKPESFVTDGETYDTFSFIGHLDVDSPTPIQKQHQKQHIILAVPKTATPFSPSNDVAKVFGLTLNA